MEWSVLLRYYAHSGTHHGSSDGGTSGLFPLRSSARNEAAEREGT